MADKVKITIDGVVREVDAGTNILQAVLDEGQIIPHFCYHEALGPAGACRMCACMIAPGPDKPARLEMSCMVRASEGMIVSVNDDYALKFRKQVSEDLMLHHPHDCPVCDEGGECMLQDMIVLTEQQHRRDRFPKRTWVNQDLGPFVYHEMNRCIQCYRCVRYYRDYALGDDFGVFGSRDRLYFGRVEDGTLQSEFSGNLVDICPTGVFTDKQFRTHYSRPWDLQTTRSVCPSCSVGCNVLPGYRNDTLRRIKPAEQPAVNRFFMCDRGRYGGEFVNHETRLTEARVEGSVTELDVALKSVADRLKEIARQHGPASIVGFGSERSSLEANAALQLLMKGLGSNRVCYFDNQDRRAAVRRAASITASGEVSVPTLTEIEQADFIMVLGGDLTAEAPMMDLAVRQSIAKGNPLFICSPRAGELDQFARASWRCVPGEEATIASFIGSVPAGTEATEDNFVHTVAAALQKAKKPLIICSVLHDDPSLIEAAFSLAKATTAYGSRTCSLAYFFPAVNSAGVALVRNDENPDSVMADIEGGRVKALVICERDLAATTQGNLPPWLSQLEFVVTIDSIETQTVQASHAVLPCVSHYQSFGTLVNYECRAQAYDGMHLPSHVNLAASEVLTALIQHAEIEDMIGGTDFQDIYDVTRESNLHMDRLRVGDNGCVIRTSPKLPPPSRKNQKDNDADLDLRLWHVYHTFGSEELSSLSTAMKERAPEFVIEMNPEDAEAKGLSDGAHYDLTNQCGIAAPLRINDKLAKGTVAVPVFINLKRTADAEALL